VRVCAHAFVCARARVSVRACAYRARNACVCVFVRVFFVCVHARACVSLHRGAVRCG
jgi:hypothetical protein